MGGRDDDIAEGGTEYHLPSGFHMAFLGSMGESVREPGRPIRGDALLAIAADII